MSLARFQSDRNALLSTIGAILAIISFFLPWLIYKGTPPHSASAWRFMLQDFSTKVNPFDTPIAFGLALLLLTACSVLLLRFSRLIMLQKITAIVGFVIACLALLFFLWLASLVTSSGPAYTNTSITQVLGVGVWLSPLGFLLMLIGSVSRQLHT